MTDISLKLNSEMLGKIAILAAFYILIGELGLLISIPPGFVSAIWPPAGVALAALLLWGYQVWPGIWIGSFVVNIFIGLNLYLRGSEAGWLAATIASGATLQACLGSFLVKRRTHFPTQLDNSRDVLGLLLWGGAIACLLNATISATTLLMTGAIPIEQFAYSWLTWWVGDTLGVFIFTPLVVLWATASQKKQKKRLISITIPLILTFTMIVGFFFFYFQYPLDPWIILATGLFFTGGVWAFLLILTGDAAQVEWMKSQLAESEKNLLNALNVVNRKSQLLNIIASEGVWYTTLEDSPVLFDAFLKHLLNLTESSYGFIAEIHYDDKRKPYLKVNGIVDRAWGEYLRRAFEGESNQASLEFHRTDTIITRPMTGEVVIGNDLDKEGRLETFTKGEVTPLSYVDMPLFAREMLVSKDLDKESLLEALAHGEYPLQSYLGMPLYAKETVVGVAAVVNCPKGYKEDLYSFLSPLLQAISHLLVSNRNERLRKTLEDSAVRYQEDLDEIRHEKEVMTEKLSNGLKEVLVNLRDETSTLLEVDAAQLSEAGKKKVDEIMEEIKHLKNLLSTLKKRK